MGFKSTARGTRQPTLYHVLMGVIVVGIALRVLTFWSGYMFWDSPYYIQMGRGLAESMDLVLPWGDPFSPASDCFLPEPSHHFSPLFPVYLASFYAVTGYTLEITRVAAIVLSILVLLVIYLTTRDLMGTDKALVVTAVFALDPVLIVATRDLMPEPLIIVLFVLTLWAIVRAIADDRYMVIAALCAAGGYLTKASVGYLFIIAGIGGFAWRFYYLRWDVFKRRYYLAAIFLFLGIIGIWSMRNILLFGWPNWQTSPYLADSLGHALGNFKEFLVTLLVTLPLFVAIFLMYGAFWLPWMKKSLSRVRGERTSAMWLAVVLVFVITLLFSAALAVYEGSDLMTHSALRIRYIVIAFPPMMWLIMDEVKLGTLEVPLRWRAASASLREMGANLSALRGEPARAVGVVVLLLASVLMSLLGLAYLVVSAMLLGGAISLLLTDARKVLVLMLAFFLLVSVEFATERVDNPQMELARDLDRLLGPGQTVAMDGGEVDMGYLYVGLGTFDFNMTTYVGDSTADFIISYYLDKDYSGYGLVKVYSHRVDPGLIKRLSLGLIPDSTPKEVLTVALWERA